MRAHTSLRASVYVTIAGASRESKSCAHSLRCLTRVASAGRVAVNTRPRLTIKGDRIEAPTDRPFVDRSNLQQICKGSNCEGQLSTRAFQFSYVASRRHSPTLR